MKQDFSRRSTQSELMDTEEFGFAAFDHCLRDLARVNRWTLAYGPTLRWIGDVARQRPGQSLTIFDIGSGGGDMLREIWRRFGRMLSLRMTGIDLNPWSYQSAEQRTDAAAPIEFVTTNIFDLPPERTADCIISSLFTHHLSDDDLVRFIQWMDRHATVGWFINDLHRHAVPFYGFGWLARLLRLDPMVQHDGPISVARAFTAQDWRGLLQRAGIDPARTVIRWHFPFRYCVACRHA